MEAEITEIETDETEKDLAEEVLAALSQDNTMPQDSWDVNDDGFLDMVYDGGSVGGSGGTWKQYYVFCWNETTGLLEEKYPEFTFWREG